MGRVEEGQPIHPVELIRIIKEILRGSLMWEWVRRGRCRGRRLIGRKVGPKVGACGTAVEVVGGSEWNGEGREGVGG